MFIQIVAVEEAGSFVAIDLLLSLLSLFSRKFEREKSFQWKRE